MRTKRNEQPTARRSQERLTEVMSKLNLEVSKEGKEGQSRMRKEALKNTAWGFPGGAVVKNPPANAGDTGSSPGPGRSQMP